MTPEQSAPYVPGCLVAYTWHGSRPQSVSYCIVVSRVRWDVNVLWLNDGELSFTPRNLLDECVEQFVVVTNVV